MAFRYGPVQPAMSAHGRNHGNGRRDVRLAELWR